MDEKKSKAGKVSEGIGKWKVGERVADEEENIRERRGMQEGTRLMGRRSGKIEGQGAQKGVEKGEK